VTSALALLGSVALIHLAAMASPGPNVLVVTQTAMSRSQRSALAVAVGVATGALILSTAAAVGLGLVFERVSWVRNAVQVAGGAYLLYLGLRIWLGADQPPPPPEPAARTGDDGLREFWGRGLLTNLTNPKAAIFFGSILAPVLDRAEADWVVAAAIFVIVVNALWWHCLLAVLFARPPVRRWYGRAKRVIDRVVGGLLALLGLRLATDSLLAR
jgi:RhtB (resistance to homoserine/threonine) family protein